MIHGVAFDPASHDAVLFGIVLSPIIPANLLALGLTVLLSWTLARLRLWRLVWRRPLVEAALYLILLGLITALSPLAGTR